MKRKDISLLFIVILILCFSQIANASGSKMISVRINNNEVNVREVPIVKNESVIKSDSPSFVYGDRTLVSARLVAESYGAKVDWDRETKTAIINQDEIEVRLTIDSDVARVNGKNVQLDKNSIPRLVSFGGKSAKTMVPINFLSEALGYKTDWDSETRTVYLLDEDEKIEETKAIKNQIKGIELKEKDGKETLEIIGSDKVQRHVMSLNNPKRYVIDLMDSELIGTNYKEYNYDVGNVKRVRVSQFTPDRNYSKDDKIVRVVLDIKEHASNPKIEIIEEGMNLAVLQKDVKIDQPVNKDPIIENNKNVGQTETKPEVPENSNDFVEELKDRDKNRSSRVIVVDAGHGGHDPGAISISGVREKDLVLEIALKLEKDLKNKGYTVLMTRGNDYFVPLNERAAFANNNYADIFVSIHGNSVGGAPSANGIEVFHTPKKDNPMKGNQQAKLARYVQEELIKATGARNRGVKTANYLVTRVTKMPSILIETGFMSNPSEDAKLNNPAYQQKLVSGITRGIDRYFNEF